MKTRIYYLITILILISFFFPLVHCQAKKKSKVSEEADLHYQLGQDFFSKGDYLSALKELIKSVELDKKNPSAQYLLGTTYLYLKRYEEAEKHLKIAISLTEGDAEGYPDAHNNLGNLYMELGRYDEAIEEFQQCLEIIFYQPNFPRVYYNIAVAYMKKGDNEKAVEYFNQAIKLDPAFCPAYLNKADIFSKAGRRQEAILEYQNVLKRCPATTIAGKARLLMGVELNEMGKRQEACEQFFIVLKEMPDTELAIKAGEYLRLIQCR